jgi:hypothetical protein
LRRDESLDEKVAYIRENPVRAGLIAEGEEWPYAIDASDLNSRPEASIVRAIEVNRPYLEAVNGVCARVELAT